MTSLEVPSDATSNLPRPTNFFDELKKLTQRVLILERASRLNSASVGQGGLRIRDGGSLTIEDGGVFQWVSDNGILTYLMTANPNALNDGRFTYYYDDTDNPGNPPVETVIIGEFPEWGGSGSSHGIAAWAHSTGRLILGVSDDGVYLNKTKAPDAGATGYSTQEVLRCPKDGTDSLTLWLDSEKPFMRLISNGADRAYIDGGRTNSATPFSTRLMLGSKEGTDTPRLIVWNINSATYADVYCEDLIYSGSLIPSSENLKNVYGEHEGGALEAVLATPVKRWSYKPEARAVVGNDSSDPVTVEDGAKETRERIGPVAEDVPPDLFVELPDGTGAIDTNAALWTMWKAIQEQQAQIDDLKQQVQTLQQKIDER